MIAAPRTHSRFSPFACGALLRTQEVGWRVALDVPDFTFRSADMRAVELGVSARRVISVARFLLSSCCTIAKNGLLRTQEVGWRGAVAVCEFPFLAF